MTGRVEGQPQLLLDLEGMDHYQVWIRWLQSSQGPILLRRGSGKGYGEDGVPRTQGCLKFFPQDTLKGVGLAKDESVGCAFDFQCTQCVDWKARPAPTGADTC